MIRFLHIRAILYGILGVISLAFIVGIAKNIYQQYNLHAQTAQVQTITQQLQKNNEGISQLIQSFQQDGTIELEGRKDLNLQKPGEQTVIIVPPKNYPQDNASPEIQAPQKHSVFEVDDSFFGQIRHRAQLWQKFLFR